MERKITKVLCGSVGVIGGAVEGFWMVPRYLIVEGKVRSGFWPYDGNGAHQLSL